MIGASRVKLGLDRLAVRQCCNPLMHGRITGLGSRLISAPADGDDDY